MNFYALSTPPGVSGIAIIRVSGDSALQIANQITRTVIDQPRSALLKSFYDQEGELIDEGILIWYPEGQSYTGEHLIEIHTHGSKAVINKLLEDLGDRKDCRLAEPGEFTKTAYQNNRINLYEAESIADLLQAETEAQRIQALRLKNSSPKFLEWRETILDVLSKTEASIDFSEEDLPEGILKNNEEKIKSIVSDIDEMLDETMGEVIRDGFKIAIIGPPNAGKSSLFNRLIGTSRALVHENAGTTRDYLEKEIRIGNYTITLVDTAGIHHTNNEIESAGVRFSSKQANLADIILCIGDCTLPYPSQFSTDFNNLVNQKPVIFVENKSDLGIKKQYEIPFKVYCSKLVSCKTGFGIEELTNTLDDLIKDTFSSSEITPFYIGKRLKGLTQDCLKNLLDFKEQLETNTGLEILSPILKFARENIDEMIGYKTNEDVLDKLFNNFCIGK